MDSGLVRIGIAAVAAHLEDSDLLELVATATGGIVNSSLNRTTITDKLVESSFSDPLQFLGRKKITKTVLFAYLKQVDVAPLVPNIKFSQLVDVIIKRWTLPASTAAPARVPADPEPDPEPVVPTDSTTDVLTALLCEQLPNQLWRQLVALETESWDVSVCFENVELEVQLKLAAPAGHQTGMKHHVQARMKCAGIAQVSSWLQVFAGTMSLENPDYQVAKSIDHNRGYMVEFHGNVHNNGLAIGEFRMHFRMVATPRDGPKIQQVHLKLIFKDLGDLAALAKVHDLGFEHDLEPGPGQHQMQLTLGLDARAQWQSASQRGLDAAKLFSVPEGTNEYTEIGAEFSKTLPFNAVDTIERVENGYQHESFSVHSKAIAAKHGAIAAKHGAGFDPTTMRRLLFHGTDAVESIVNDMVSGFKPLLSGTVTGAIHGDGTYFARDAKYSDHYARVLPSGQKQMMLVDVAVGRWAKGARGLKTCPVLPGEQYNCYDSLVDEVANPSIFVVQHGAQAYPAYLITYH